MFLRSFFSMPSADGTVICFPAARLRYVTVSGSYLYFAISTAFLTFSSETLLLETILSLAPEGGVDLGRLPFSVKVIVTKGLGLSKVISLLVKLSLSSMSQSK